MKGTERASRRGIALVASRSVTLAAMALAAVAILTACKSSAAGGSTPPAGTATSVPGTATSSTAPPGTGTATPAAATGSCSVITTAEASAALGQPVKAPVLGRAYVEGGRACVYYGPNVPPGISPDIPISDSVRVVLVTGPKAVRYFDHYRSTVHAQPVNGLGDQAFYDGYASISVLKGAAYVRIYCGPFGKLGPEEQLARDALPRM